MLSIGVIVGIAAGVLWMVWMLGGWNPVDPWHEATQFVNEKEIVSIMAAGIGDHDGSKPGCSICEAVKRARYIVESTANEL